MGNALLIFATLHSVQLISFFLFFTCVRIVGAPKTLFASEYQPLTFKMLSVL